MERVYDNENPGALGIYLHQMQRGTEKADQQSRKNDTGAQKAHLAMWFQLHNFSWGSRRNPCFLIIRSPICLNKFELISLFGTKNLIMTILKIDQIVKTMIMKLANCLHD